MRGELERGEKGIQAVDKALIIAVRYRPWSLNRSNEWQISIILIRTAPLIPPTSTDGEGPLRRWLLVTEMAFSRAGGIALRDWTWH